MQWKIPLSDIDFGPEEMAAVDDVLRSKWLTTTPTGTSSCLGLSRFLTLIDSKHRLWL